MTELKTAKYIRNTIPRRNNHPDAITGPIPMLASTEDYGNHGFNMYWEGITKAFTHASEPHCHAFAQYLIFSGGDVNNLTDLGAEVEIHLGEDEQHMEKHFFTTSTTVYIPPGLFHGPLIYHKVTRPFMFMDLYFAAQYARKGQPRA